MYNSTYFSQMAFPDFDMFQSHNLNATFHAIARAINNGPIYITDNLGEQNFSVLKPLVYADGKIVKSETSLLPTEDCLFQVQDAQLLKGYSRVRNTGLLGVWNAADAATVNGTIAPKDVNGIAGNEFVIYEHFSKAVKKVTKDEMLHVALPRLGYKLFYVVPLENDFAPFGLTNKYNAPATILAVEKSANEIELTLYEGGSFNAYAKNKPKRITASGISVTTFSFVNNILTLEVPFGKPGSHPVVSIYW
jgi:raffinose synthase